jgi:hypothetical protein
MAYHILFLLLAAGAVYEWRSGATPAWLYRGLLLGLTLFLCLRYGQGSDYFSYGHIYRELPQNLWAALRSSNIHSEPGWKVLCVLCRSVGMPYPLFVALLSLGMMGLLTRFLGRYCKFKLLGLLLCWHTLYLTYFFSILRQGLALALLLGLLLPWLEKKRYARYYLGCAVCALLHSSALILTLLPLLQVLPWKLKHLLVLTGIAWAGGLLLASGLFRGLLVQLLPRAVTKYLETGQVSLFAAAERLVSYGAVYLCWHWYGEKTDARLRLLMGIATVGLLLYGGTLWAPLVASRTAYYCKAVEIALLSTLLPRRGWQGAAALGFCLVLAAGMHAKNILSYIGQLPYYETVNLLNYPYVAVFWKEKIQKYLQLPYGYLP